MSINIYLDACMCVLQALKCALCACPCVRLHPEWGREPGKWSCKSLLTDTRHWVCWETELRLLPGLTISHCANLVSRKRGIHSFTQRPQQEHIPWGVPLGCSALSSNFQREKHHSKGLFYAQWAVDSAHS